MSLAMTIFSILAVRISLAISMLWGVFRIARGHYSLLHDDDVLALAGSTIQLSRRCHLAPTQDDARDETRPLNEPFGAPRMYPMTPDGRYFVVNGKLWRCSNPSLPEDARQKLVTELMDARREVKTAKAPGNEG